MTDTKELLEKAAKAAGYGISPRRAQSTTQHERIPSARKKIEKPWSACYRWGRGGRHTMRHRFATEAQAAAYIAKQQRASSMHPSTGKPWGPMEWWIEGPGVRAAAAIGEAMP